MPSPQDIEALYKLDLRGKIDKNWRLGWHHTQLRKKEMETKMTAKVEIKMNARVEIKMSMRIEVKTKKMRVMITTKRRSRQPNFICVLQRVFSVFQNVVENVPGFPEARHFCQGLSGGGEKARLAGRAFYPPPFNP
ncbi:hypothetical protein Gogos_000783 [Gossypium gossypioides]|uniref:Uncharacterized protein n=1 Tax=Gossypium gossypioides TaxID=34282 RepID=A0A7J9CU16_GOSGO|nr:hypothetical protein [Gossypium gossypioides]